MSDLMKSLVSPGIQTYHTSSSEESFHSVDTDTHSSSQSFLQAPINDSANKSNPQPVQAPNLADASAHNGVQVYDVDAYLADPANAALLSKENTPLQPVPLGTQTSHNVSVLYSLCQTKGLIPVFEIDGEADKAIFWGVLKIGDATIVLNEKWRSKKEARERLAGKAVDLVKGMEAKKKLNGSGNGTEQSAGEKGPNWVGMLQEYHNHHFSSTASPVYTFYTLGPAYFACTCALPSHPSHLFGAPTTRFPSKKQARATAAAEAVRFLVTEGKLNKDGGVIPKAKATPTSGASSSAAGATKKLAAAGSGGEGGGGGGKGIAGSTVRLHTHTASTTSTPNGDSDPKPWLQVQPSSTYAQRVTDLATLLGFNTPQYVLRPANANAPNLLSGWATFPNATGIAGEGVGGAGGETKLGEVWNVYGKRNAKEEVARGVWDVLVGVAAERGVGVEGVGGVRAGG